ncbi:MAG TPA: MFS transporter [Candidatus Dormibacteraeota bacterium]|nr:MFS transporter [Candidatus Dormibacteraeota bacterium]
MTAAATAGAPGAREGRSAVAGPETGARRGAPSWLVLLLVCLGQYMVILDVSIVNVALPSIRTDLGFSPTSLQWVVNAYTLAFAGFLLLGGRAADLFGRRRLFLVGVGLFAVASLAGGLSTNQAELVIARTVQGLGGAILSPATLTLLLTNYAEGPARARALGVWSAVAAAGGASGALLGGIVTDTIGWRWILFINVPVGIAVLVGARLVLSESRGDTAAARHLDVPGALTVTGGMVALVWGITRSEALGFGSREVELSLVAGALLLAVFVLVEARFSVAPLVPLRLFRSRSVTGANIVMFGVGAAIFPVWYFLTLYLQLVRGESPLVAGLVFLPQTVAIVIGSQVSSRLMSRIGARPILVAGPLLCAIGLLWLRLLPLDGDLIATVILPGSIVTLGMGLAFPAVAMAATAGVPRSEAGLASGVVNTTRQMGASVSLAVLATVAADHTSSVQASAGSAAAALTQGYSYALAIAVLVALASGLAALIIPGRVRPPAPATAHVEAAAEAAPA